MTDLEYQETFERIVALLRSEGMDWLVDQVMTEVKHGKLDYKEVATLRVASSEGAQGDLFLDGPSYKSGKKDTFPISVSYTPKEQLELLVSAIEKAIIDTHEMESSVFDYLTERHEKISEITFIPEDKVESDSEEPEILSLSKGTVAERREVIEDLRALLSVLRKEIS